MRVIQNRELPKAEGIKDAVLADYIRKLLIELRNQRAELANAINVSLSSVLNFETGNTTPAAGGTYYLGLFSSGTESQVVYRAPFSGTIKNLQCYCDTAPSAGQSFIYTIRKAGVDSSVTVTISDTATEGSDNTNTVTVTRGDQVSVKLVTSAGAAVARHHVTGLLEA